jgi:hypothetical protein
MDYKCKEGMIDNRKVNDNHQKGIERVLQRKTDRNDVEGHNGKMGRGTHSESNWKRGDSLTPRKA